MKAKEEEESKREGRKETEEEQKERERIRNEIREREQERIVRVFISSTFRDMQEERDVLVKKVFPEIKELCREKEVTFVEIDLRWGITEEQAKRGEVIPICLAEIDGSRPYFIGLLGERYGWVPSTKEIDEDLISDQPWLEDHPGKSATELEIVYGVLQNPEMADHAFFYFRDPAYFQTIPEEKRKDYEEEQEASKAKLARLKERIRTSGLPVRENYKRPEEVGELILADLKQIITTKYPKGSEKSPLEREREQHQAFAKSRERVYIGRKEYYERLDRHVKGTEEEERGRPLVVLGESGAGKTALLANWLQQYQEEHPEAFVVAHFIGSTPASTDYGQIMKRLMEEIKAHYQLEEEVPVEIEQMREALPTWLVKAATQGRMVLILDGLNQLEEREAGKAEAQELHWLPRIFPANVRVLMSTLPGRSLEAVRERGWPTMTVEPLDPAGKEQLIIEYLEQYRKRLDQGQIKKLVDTEATNNPLYLRVLLEELRIFGKYEELDTRIRYYLEAKTPVALYEKIITRWEEDYERDRKGLVRDALSILWGARYGLTEEEMLDMVKGERDARLPRAIWSPLYLAMKDSLVSRSGLLTFFHDYLRTAVEKKYLSGKEWKLAVHQVLADYFEDQPITPRKLAELPWQLFHAEAWGELKTCLVDLEIFELLMKEGRRYELLGYWLELETQAQYDMADTYAQALTQYEEVKPAENLGVSMALVASFLKEAGRYSKAEPHARRALAITEQALGKDHPDTGTRLNNLALLLVDMGRYEEAEPLFQRTLAIIEQALGKDHSTTGASLNNLASLLGHMGRYEEAEPLHRRALAITEQALGPDHPDTGANLNNLAGLLMSMGRYEEAEPLYRRALAIIEQALGKDHSTTGASLDNLAHLLGSMGRYEEAEPLHRRAVAIT
ncbi:MAG: tetratricopeptide repeat protein, partial [Candidatus Hermodarchaeota archaeon]